MSNVSRVYNIRVSLREGRQDYLVAHRFLVYHAKSKGPRDSDTGCVRC